MDDRRARSTPEALEEAERKACQPRRDDLFLTLDVSRVVRATCDELRAQLEPGTPPLSAPAHLLERLSARTLYILHQIAELEEGLWDFYRAVEARRDEQDASPTLPFGADAHEELVKLHADLVAFAAKLPPDEMLRKRKKQFAERYNELSTYDRYCPACFSRFALVPGDRRTVRSSYCSDGCAARKRNQGRKRVSKADKAKERFERHMAKCRICRSEGLCPLGTEALDTERTIRARTRTLKE